MRYSFLTLLFTFLLTSCNQRDLLRNGDYSLSSVSFQDGAPFETMSDYLSSHKVFTVKDDTIIFPESVKIKYSYDSGYLYVKKDSIEKKYECEDFSSGSKAEYVIVIDDEIVKHIRIVSQ